MLEDVDDGEGERRTRRGPNTVLVDLGRADNMAEYLVQLRNQASPPSSTIRGHCDKKWRHIERSLSCPG
ncbi:uncharacterized, partial [Lates japonicus]